MKRTGSYLYLIVFAVGFIFLKNGYNKLVAGDFIASLPAALEKFVLQNPYPFFKSILSNSVVPNYVFIGSLTIWAELLIGVCITALSILFIFESKAKKSFSVLFLIVLLAGFVFNLISYLAVSWTDPSIDSLNFLMMAIEAFGFIYVYNGIRAAK